MKWLKNFDRLLEIQRNIVWPSVLEMDSKQYFPEFLKSALSKQPCERLIVSPRRQILIEGQLLLLDYGKPNDMHVILFDDLLLITRRKKSISKKVSFEIEILYRIGLITVLSYILTSSSYSKFGIHSTLIIVKKTYQGATVLQLLWHLIIGCNLNLNIYESKRSNTLNVSPVALYSW